MDQLHSSPRRIAIVTESFYPAVDGTTRTNKQVVDRLITLGHDVRIIAPGPGLATYRNAPVSRIRPLDKPGRQVHAALADFAPDLVHVASPGILGRKALKHAQRLGAETLVVQQSPVQPLTAEHWLRKVHARADTVVVTCDWMQQRLDTLGVEAPVWRPGVDVAAWNPNLRDDFLHASWSRWNKERTPRVVVGFVGSLHKRHGVRRLVEVASVPGVRLVVIGDGPQRGWLEERLGDAKFLGEVEPGDLATAMATLDVLVHPGEQQTCAHALREASASGVPVVAPRTGGAVDAVRNLETGLLHDPAPGGLRSAIASIVADRQRRLLGERGRELAVGRSWVEACDELFADHYRLAHPVAV
ncbi:phosphatidylinositol alpha 1,6-mannosyltransferase [Nocardioides daedukensis]|uniref:Phosphatidylinositol alpha 1,6-mannosyltransferase n=1 Tax=Nocardioides daedukensis TaxID=634462 RepID=A0A7Y9URV3_9ACTN|nr:glycosyltransferase [Nocardioides daedukensis]NYG60221.1 phosphatidylinositol alpha 1,6-mannosyltransferase [Nocardioides daedukensis]